jgi:hypothetical protein
LRIPSKGHDSFYIIPMKQTLSFIHMVIDVEQKKLGENDTAIRCIYDFVDDLVLFPFAFDV